MISNCIFTWGLTSTTETVVKTYELWIDFKLYFYVRTHKKTSVAVLSKTVVNWFQIVFLREDSQERRFVWIRIDCCELISNCIFTWGLTSLQSRERNAYVLWIDFKLYFYVRTHKNKYTCQKLTIVVNWFQIVFLREDSQATLKSVHWTSCCELISNCIFTWGLTSHSFNVLAFGELWIDFKLYFYVRTHKI